jgi:hypothetical protein
LFHLFCKQNTTCLSSDWNCPAWPSWPYLEVQGFNILQKKSFPLEITSFPRKSRDSSRKYHGSLAWKCSTTYTSSSWISGGPQLVLFWFRSIPCGPDPTEATTKNLQRMKLYGFSSCSVLDQDISPPHSYSSCLLLLSKSQHLIGHCSNKWTNQQVLSFKKNLRSHSVLSALQSSHSTSVHSPDSKQFAVVSCSRQWTWTDFSSHLHHYQLNPIPAPHPPPTVQIARTIIQKFLAMRHWNETGFSSSHQRLVQTQLECTDRVSVLCTCPVCLPCGDPASPSSASLEVSCYLVWGDASGQRG